MNDVSIYITSKYYYELIPASRIYTKNIYEAGTDEL